MSKEEMEGLLKYVKYKDWQFRVEERGEHLYLQVYFPEVCISSGKQETQHGRKWILSKHMCKSEVITTAFKAVITAEEHEIREQFKYRGRMVFGPHFDVDALWQVARTIDIRKDPATIETY